jgi:hypothetical protein
LLFLLFVQDIGHAYGGYKPSRGVNVPDSIPLEPGGKDRETNIQGNLRQPPLFPGILVHPSVLDHDFHICEARDVE